MQRAQGRTETASGKLDDLGRPRKRTKTLLDRANTFQTIQNRRRDAATRKRRKPRGADVDDFIFIGPEAFSPEQFHEDNIHRRIGGVAADNFSRAAVQWS